MQIGGGAGGAGAADGQVARAVEALRYRDEPARHFARVRSEDRPDDAQAFARRVAELTQNHSSLKAIAEALTAVHEALLRELCVFEKQVRLLAKSDQRVRLLMTTPGVGAIVALTYVSAIDDPGRFSSSKRVGAHFGLTPKKYQSGETDITGRISKTGDGGVRAVLFEAAHLILTRPLKAGALKSWALEHRAFNRTHSLRH